MIESLYIKALLYFKNYTEFNCIKLFCNFTFVRQLMHYKEKKETVDSYVDTLKQKEKNSLILHLGLVQIKSCIKGLLNDETRQENFKM